MVLLMFGRFVAAPLVMLAVIAGASVFIAVDSLAGKVFITQAAMAAMSQVSILAREYGADYEYAAVLVGAATLLSLCVIPVIKVLLG